jgi:hypothetical protein
MLELSSEYVDKLNNLNNLLDKYENEIKKVNLK